MAFCLCAENITKALKKIHRNEHQNMFTAFQTGEQRPGHTPRPN